LLLPLLPMSIVSLLLLLLLMMMMMMMMMVYVCAAPQCAAVLETSLPPLAGGRLAAAVL
jgi:hypothetical protein